MNRITAIQKLDGYVIIYHLYISSVYSRAQYRAYYYHYYD